MKKLPFFLTLLFVFAAFGFRPVPAEDDAALCGSAILSECIGACGGDFKVSTTAPVTGVYCYEATSSLCPNTGALAALKVGDNLLFTGDVSGGISFNFLANAGDKITIAAELFAKKSDIVCVWLGEVNIDVRRP